MATPTNLPASFTTGQVLTATQQNDLRGAFRVLQVVHGTTTTSMTNNTTTFVDTNLTATITPQSTTSKILVYISQGVATGAATVQEIQVLRNATLVNTFGHILLNDAAVTIGYTSLISYDAPSSTSALIYKTQARRRSGAGASTNQYTDANGVQRSQIILLEISA